MSSTNNAPVLGLVVGENSGQADMYAMAEDLDEKRIEPQVTQNRIPEEAPLLSSPEGVSNPETPNSASASSLLSTKTHNKTHNETKNQKEPSSIFHNRLSSAKKKILLITVALLISMVVLGVILWLFLFVPVISISCKGPLLWPPCPEELYSRQVISVHANNYFNYTKRMKNNYTDFVSAQITLSLDIKDPIGWFPMATLRRAPTVTELHISGNVCTESFLSILNQVSCVRVIHLNKVQLKTCRNSTQNKMSLNYTATLLQLETLVINDTLSSANNDMFAFFDQNVRMEYMKNIKILKTNVTDENVHHIQHIIAQSSDLQSLEMSGFSSAKEPFYNNIFPVKTLKHMAWNQSVDSQLIGSDVLKLNPYFYDAFPNIEIFESRQGVVRYNDRLNLFSCKNLTKLSVMIRISSEDMLDTGSIGIIERLTKLKDLKLYLLFGGSECPTLEEINVLGLKDIVDNFKICTLNIKSNCEIVPGFMSIDRMVEGGICERNASFY